LLAAVCDPFTADGLGVHAAVTRVDERTIRIQYDGKSAAQAGDFVADAEYLKHWKFDVDSGGPPRVTWLDSAFAVDGKGALRLPIVVAAPFRAEWRVEWPEHSQCLVCFCDDGRTKLFAVGINGEIVVDDDGLRGNAKSEIKTYVDTQYTVAMRHDGKSLATTVDGKEAARTEQFGSRTWGGVLLNVVGARPCRLHWLTVETTLDAAAIARVRKQYVERRLREIFGAAK
jgi:hypothetical protein